MRQPTICAASKGSQRPQDITLSIPRIQEDLAGLWDFIPQINTNDPDHARCLDPLGDDDYPSSTYTAPFDISFYLPTDDPNVYCTRVRYTLDGTDPNPNSPYVLLDASGNGVLQIDGRRVA